MKLLKILLMTCALACLALPAIADNKSKDSATEPAKPAASAPAPIAIPAERFEVLRKLTLARQNAQMAYDFILNSAYLDKSSGCAQTLLAGLQKEAELAGVRLELALAEAREEFNIPRGYIVDYQKQAFSPPALAGGGKPGATKE